MRQVPSIQCCLVVKLGLTLATTWAGAHQAPLSMHFSKQEYWSGFPFQPESDPKPDQLVESFTIQLYLTTQSLSGGFPRWWRP